MTTLTSIVRASGFATTAQGELADTAVQPNDSPTLGNITIDNGTSSAINNTSSGSLLIKNNGTNKAEFHSNGNLYISSGVLVSYGTGTSTFAGTADVNNLKIGGAQGTDGQVLTSTGSGVGWEAAGGGGGGGSMTHVSTATVSGTSTSAVALTMDNTYKTYKLYTNFAQNASVAGQIYVRLTDGGTPITTTVYNGYRRYNGGGFVINTQNFMANAGGTGSAARVIQEWTIYMDGNDIEVMRYEETSWATPTASSPTSQLGDSGYMLNSSYSASGNIDGLSFTTPNAVFAPGSTFILYGLAE